MYIEPLRDYQKLVNEVENTAKKDNYNKVLNISLEALSLLPSAYNTSQKKNKQINNFSPVIYSFKYLTVLQEKKELDYIRKMLNNINKEEIINNELSTFSRNYSTICNIMNYICNYNTVYFDNLVEKFNLNKNELSQILKAAEEINLINRLKDNDTIIIKDIRCNANLQKILHSKNENNKKNILNKLTNFFS